MPKNRQQNQMEFPLLPRTAKKAARKRTRILRPPAKPIRLSPTTGLNLFLECPRCFWLHYNERLRRPQGPFPSLPGGMDLVIKTYYDRYRGSLPPELVGKVRGVLVPDHSTMDRWRNWRTGLEYRDERRQAVLFGALDDCLVDNGQYLPLDYKTRGSAPRPGDSERYYQMQLDTYALLLSENGYPAGGEAFLVYYFPTAASEEGRVKFSVQPIRLVTDPERARRTFEKAIETLRGKIPSKHTACLYCLWSETLAAFD